MDLDIQNNNQKTDEAGKLTSEHKEAIPKQKHEKSFLMNCFSACMILFILLVLVIAGMYAYGRSLMTKAVGESTDTKEFVITEGQGAQQISKNLKKADLISSSLVFQWLVVKEDLSLYFQPGEYQLSQHMTMEEIARTIAHKKEKIEEQDVLFLEGWTLEQVVAQVANKTQIDADEFRERVTHPHTHYDDYDFVRALPQDATLEGYLFPDTYRIGENTDADKLIRVMLSNFGKKFSYELRAKAEAQGRSVHDIVILASIIEREVQTDEDKKLVAGVFYNRLEIGQRLEADSTVNYVLGTDKPAVSLDDTKTESPYNTYANAGLPIGPISNPGFASIDAALFPAETDYYYFLSTLDTGETIFAKTFAEHVQNKNKYLR